MDSKEKKVITYYNSFSSQYDKIYKKIQFAKFSSSSKYLPKFHLPLIFDFGGGTGLFSNFSNNTLINLDISFDMLLQGLKNGRTFLPIACDLQSVPIRQQAISSIVSFTAIQNCSNQAIAISEIARTLKNQGECILTMLRKITETPNILGIFHDLQFKFSEIYIPVEDIAFHLVKKT